MSVHIKHCPSALCLGITYEVRLYTGLSDMSSPSTISYSPSRYDRSGTATLTRLHGPALTSLVRARTSGEGLHAAGDELPGVLVSPSGQATQEAASCRASGGARQPRVNSHGYSVAQLSAAA